MRLLYLLFAMFVFMASCASSDCNNYGNRAMYDVAKNKLDIGGGIFTDSRDIKLCDKDKDLVLSSVRSYFVKYGERLGVSHDNWVFIKIRQYEHGEVAVKYYDTKHKMELMVNVVYTIDHGWIYASGTFGDSLDFPILVYDHDDL